MNNLLEVKNLSVGFNIDDNVYCAINGINLAFEQGKIHCIVGESGCGKSVFINSILKLLPKNAVIKSGEIIYNNTNLRYKLGKNLSYNPKEVFTIKNPAQAQLPTPNLSTSYVFATGNSFLAYPNNYNYYVSYYKDTFQHGGISMEEMIVPLVTLRGRKRK